MDDPNITMEEYIRLEEEKAQKCDKVYNWETATYGKIWDNEDVHDLGSVETEFPAIVFNDMLTSEATLLCEPTVSSLNDNEIDFRISFDESDDEDYMVIYDKNSFSYKIISVNDLKMDSENDNQKVNTPSFLSPEPTVSCFDDLDFFKDFENEFPAIVYNDALTSKSDFLNEPISIEDEEVSLVDGVLEGALGALGGRRWSTCTRIRSWTSSSSSSSHHHCVDEMTCLDDEMMKKIRNDVPCHDHFEVVEFVLGQEDA
ncbi:hypothetical protein Tco_0988639 [Tanacetum coccineum]|uniref:Uncharacterized protein n=1 Tax=Tanacetum coccineum TaxID=301880 RepID=A0ABQ5ERK8_9ASTR